MFYVGWILFTATGIIASIAIFIWAIRSGQFADQGRARYLALEDEPSALGDAPKSTRSMEAYALLGVIGVVLMSMGIAIFMVISNAYF
jgi:cbb3-type cytochrome oxidase maturation protein